MRIILSAPPPQRAADYPCLLISWIVGALDASWRATFEIIHMSFPERSGPFRTQWRMNAGWDMNKINKLLEIWTHEKQSEEKYAGDSDADPVADA